MKNKKFLIVIFSLIFLLSSCSLMGKVNNKNINENNNPVVNNPDKNPNSSNTGEAEKDPNSTINNNDNTTSVNGKESTENKENTSTGTPTQTGTSPIDKPNNGAGGNTSTQLSNEKLGWYYTPNSKNEVPEIPAVRKKLLEKYNGYYVGDTSSKVIYLTFDEGYENGYTPKILDVLKKTGVKAAFFVTKPYILKEPDLVKRMVDEGHLVLNHSDTHPSMPSKTGSPDSFKKEFENVEKAFFDLTGKDMLKFFRPPMGEFSEKSLKMTSDLGYKSIFWSFAYRDWVVDDQPTQDFSKKKIIGGLHNGEIMLLHAVSKTNTDVLEDIINEATSLGYEFKSLDSIK